mgnify:CR=1 FL=1
MTRNEEYVRLILLVRAGGEAGAEAYVELYTLGFKQVRNWAQFKWGCDHDLAEDLAALTMHTVLQKLAEVDLSQSFLGWAQTIAHRRLIDLIRRDGRCSRLDENAVAPADSPEVVETEHNLRLFYLRRRLNEQEAAVLDLLIAFTGEIKRVAAALGLSESRVYQLREQIRHKARRD